MPCNTPRKSPTLCKRKIVSLLALLAVSCGTSYAGNRRPIPAQGDGPGRQTLDVRIYRNFLVVAEGQIGVSSEPQNFILDTGSAPSIVNERVVQQLGLSTQAAWTAALGRRVPLQAATIPSLELGPIRAESLPVLVKDLSRQEHDYGIPIAGIIGLDVLSKSSFRLDYDAADIKFGEVARKGIPVPFDARTGTAVAEARIEGKPVRMLVDTGSDSLVILGGNFADTGWPRLRNASQTGSSIADQNMELKIVSAPDIVIGGKRFSKDHVYVVPGSSDPAFDALLGVRALGFRALSFDRESQTIFLEK
jgi:predicted aspartyl protease